MIGKGLIEPFYDRDGEPVKVGDEIYVSGNKRLVRRMTAIFKEDGVSWSFVVSRNVAGVNRIETIPNPVSEKISHKEPDSWEKLEEDLTRALNGEPIRYCLVRGIDYEGVSCNDIPANICQDAIRRAKKLSELEA